MRRCRTRWLQTAVLCSACMLVFVARCGRAGESTDGNKRSTSIAATTVWQSTGVEQALSPTQVAVDTATPSPTPTRLPSTTPRPSPSPTLVLTRVPTPSRRPTSTPTQVPRRRVVAFVSDVTGDDDVYLLDVETGEVVNLTRAPGEDRDPAFSADGRWLSYHSNAGGSWRLVRIDLTTGGRELTACGVPAAGAWVGSLSWGMSSDPRCVYESYQEGNLDLFVGTEGGVVSPLTRDQAGDYAPAWRPNAEQIAFTSWREGQKDLYLIDANGENLARLTSDAFDQEDPTWHPDGQRLAYVCWQAYNADLCELDLSSGAITRLTDDPYPDVSPSYGPDGTLFWTHYEPGEPFERHDPYRPGRWRLWMRDAEGMQRMVAPPVDEMDVYTPAAGYAPWPARVFPLLTAPTPTPAPVPGTLVELARLDIECAGGDPRVPAPLADAYQVWRDEIYAQSGYDFLGTVSDIFRPLGYSRRDYGHLSWHRTGRAVDFLFEWYDPEDDQNRLLVVREDLGEQTYWRLYLACREQDGSMGEPLTVAPWIFWFNLDPAREPEAYAAGGKPDAIPPGYYLDLTRLAKQHGWHRIASYEEADFNWKTDSVGREFWHYQRVEGLTWWQAMGQIYPLETLEQTYSWEVCTESLGMDPAWLETKGIPTPTPAR